MQIRMSATVKKIEKMCCIHRFVALDRITFVLWQFNI